MITTMITLIPEGEMPQCPFIEHHILVGVSSFLLHDDYEHKDNHGHGNNNQNAIPGCSSFSGLSLGLGSSVHQSDLSLAGLSLQQQGGHGLSLQQGGPSLQQGQRLNLKLNLTHLDLTDCVRLKDDCLRGILQASAKYGS